MSGAVIVRGSAAALIAAMSLAAPSGGAQAQSLPAAIPSPAASMAQAQALAAARAAVGPMPGDSDPAGQAAWRIRGFDLRIQGDRSATSVMDDSVEAERKAVGQFKASQADDPARLTAIKMLDSSTNLQNLSRLDEQAAVSARDAVANAETVRLAVLAGVRPAADLTTARDAASKAQHLADAAEQAIQDGAMAMVQGAMSNHFPDLTDSPGLAEAPGSVGLGRALNDQMSEMRDRLNKYVDLQQRARIEGVAYSAVRAAVEAGQRPASDLDTAAQSLKAAQEAMYDASDQMMDASRASIATSTAEIAEMQRQTQRRIEGEETQIAALEARIPTLPESVRPQFQDELARNKAQLENEKKLAASTTATAIPTLPAPTPRPPLPVLPPR